MLIEVKSSKDEPNKYNELLDSLPSWSGFTANWENVLLLRKNILKKSQSESNMDFIDVKVKT